MRDKKLYCVIGNKTAADVVAGNDEVIVRGLTLEEARQRAIAAQKSKEFIAAWVEADSPSRTFNQQ